MLAPFAFGGSALAQDVGSAGGVSGDGGGAVAPTSTPRRFPTAVRAVSTQGSTGLLFELHGNYYQIMGRTNILSEDPRFDAARARLYQLFKDEWTGYQGILRTGAYASNDALAHLVAGKQVELLSDQQVTTLILRHLPHEAPALLPASALPATFRAPATALAATAATAIPGNAARAATAAAAGVSEFWWTGPWGIGAIAATAALIWWVWPGHSSFLARVMN